jgi:hypothetical protein
MAKKKIFMVEGFKYGDYYCDFIEAPNPSLAKKVFLEEFGNDFKKIKISLFKLAV